MSGSNLSQADSNHESRHPAARASRTAMFAVCREVALIVMGAVHVQPVGRASHQLLRARSMISSVWDDEG